MAADPRSVPPGAQPVRLQVVAAGNGWWVNTGPDPSDIATYVFVDVEAHPELLDLPARANEPDWAVDAAWQAEAESLAIHVRGPHAVTLEIPVNLPELEAVRRARHLYVCPTTPELGISPFLARDRSFHVDLPHRNRR